MSKIAGDINKQMMRDAHARAINAPALELIADILEKHTNGVLAGAREHIERRKSRRKADEALLRQALAALETGRDYAFETAEQFHIEMRGYKQQRHDAMDADVKRIDNTISALRTRLSDGTNLSPTHYDPTDNEGSEP